MIPSLGDLTVGVGLVFPPTSIIAHATFALLSMEISRVSGSLRACCCTSFTLAKIASVSLVFFSGLPSDPLEPVVHAVEDVPQHAFAGNFSEGWPVAIKASRTSAAERIAYRRDDFSCGSA